LISEDTVIILASFGSMRSDPAEASDRNKVLFSKVFPKNRILSIYTSHSVRAYYEKKGSPLFSITQILENLLREGVTSVLVQPLQMLPGHEYEKLRGDLILFADSFPQFLFGEPLITSEKDMADLFDALSAAYPLKENEGMLLMAHGTTHRVNRYYEEMQHVLKERYPAVRLAALEGTLSLSPELAYFQKKKIRTIHLVPLMFKIGKHVLVDMNGSTPSSWKEQLKAAGFEVVTHPAGLMELKAVQAFWIEKTNTAKPFDRKEPIDE